MNILLVDDDKLDRMLVKRTLAKSSLQVNITEAVTVDEGLQHYANNRFDVVLLDYRMPQRDGIEMIVEIRNEPKDSSTAIVMMSTSEDEDLAIECIKAGAQDFLVKSEITGIRLRRAIQHATTRFELEKQLYQTYQTVKVLAETDSLTGLPNRYFFDETLKQAIVSNRRDQQKLALLLLDLDNFKLVNDNFGHDTGDVLLKKMVARIKGCLREDELFARLGGDEFTITLTNLESAEQASFVATRIVSVMQKPIEIAGTSINATVSIGIALHPENGRNSEELFKYADIAMYRAKKLGRNQVCFFEAEMQQKFHFRLMIETELRAALEKRQFELHFQPVINPIENQLLGFEALLRWRVDDNLRGPDEFIKIAEETRQIVPIGNWVAENAIKALSGWNKKSKKILRMAINVSPVQLVENNFTEKLSLYLSRYEVSPELIDIELTETALLENTEAMRSAISSISDIGCNLSLDDFGTGYSSLSHLRNYPISTVKIDRSLMPESEDDLKNMTLIEGVVSMAKILGLHIVAEGIETELHVNLCKNLQISSAQGYFYSRPLAEIDIDSQFFS